MQDVVDVTGDSPPPRKRRAEPQEPEPSRRTLRKTESRVLFSDVMAQTREMERIKSDKSRPPPPRKGETTDSPGGAESAQRKKQKRAEERRSARQKLRRLSPRSPDGGPQLPLRGGVGLAKLDGGDTPRRRFARDEDAIQDASLHSTAWRNIKFDRSPLNLLPDTSGVLQPYALQMDAALDEFDVELKDKCKLSTDFLQPKALTETSGTLAEARDAAQMDERVKTLMEEAAPIVKQSHAKRANAVLANTRQQIAVYLEQRPMIRAQAATITGLPLQISRLEKVAARRMLRNAEFATDGEERPRYAVGRTESGLAGSVSPERVTYLSKIAPLPRSTTCMLVWGTHRVEDDPIIRFVPYFSAGKNAKSKAPQFGVTGRCKDTLVGVDDEINEYVLRYVVGSCGGDQTVFEALQRSGGFAQPFANYFDILERVTRERLYTGRLQELELLMNNDGISTHRKQALGRLLEKCNAVRAGKHLRGRLQPLPSNVVWNLLAENGELGVRSAPSKQFREVAIKYQDFFCRRCCMYSCRNHGREQPIPAVRVDPKYPAAKASSKLWRRVEKELKAEEQAEDSPVEDADVQMDDDQSSESEPMSELTTSAGNEREQDTENVPEGESMRRSRRANTAASTKASSKLEVVRHHIKKVVRTKTTDVSEYLGLNSVYQALTQDKRQALLSGESRCGPYCSKVTSDVVHDDQTNGFGTSQQGKPWDDLEMVLLTKLEKCVGPNPCLLAVLLTTRTCADVAAFLGQRNSQVKGGLDSLSLIRSGRNRERSNGVLGNSNEHLRRTRSQRMKDRGANHEYAPCNHDGGSCDSAQCSCMRRDHYCEKSCGCSPDCSNRFPGCHCELGQCRTSECPCYFASRECDPDVCTSCGACELPVVVADQNSNAKTLAQVKMCGNVNIMRGQMRKIGMGASKTHGWGAYAKEDVKRGDFMYEYTGSLLSQDEAERRGNVYDKTTISFLFDLNEDSVVDATRKGNKSKFANHDSNEPKCFARIMLVNGDHRIGIYAKEDISAGDELFFDYGYSGVIPDWSQARIGSGKDTPSIEEVEKEPKGSVAAVEEEVKA